MLEDIQYESIITIENIPIQWISKIELYYPDLPQFPIIYIHIQHEGVRIYGFPVSHSIELKEDQMCDLDLRFVCNINLDDHEEIKNLVKQQLEERIGASDKFNLQDVKSFCKGNLIYEDFFEEIWKYTSQAFGKFIPYGQLYEELYSIVRFVSAFDPKTGRQSEMRMLYNFLSIFGERIEILNKWNHLEFFILPTFSNTMKEEFDDFPKYEKLHRTMKKVWNHCFNGNFNVDGTTFNSIKKGHSWPRKKEDFINKISKKLLSEEIIDLDDKFQFERLVDAFNRYSWRAAYYISSVMQSKNKNYGEWDKDFFIKFYTGKTGVGISEKVVACFLQQGFKKSEFIPIDIWIGSFQEYVLGIEDSEDFFKSFNSLGKLERLIWFVCQARKTNMKTFFDILWCIRFGNTGNKNMREANPIACYECKLKLKCPNYNKIKTKLVLIVDKNDVSIKREKSGDIIDSIQNCSILLEQSPHFICIIDNSVPKMVFKNQKNKWILIDEFSGYLLTNQVLKLRGIQSMEAIIDNLPEFKVDFQHNLFIDEE